MHPTKMLCWADEDSDDDWTAACYEPVEVPKVAEEERERAEQQRREREALVEAMKKGAEERQQQKREEMARRESEQEAHAYFPSYPTTTYGLATPNSSFHTPSRRSPMTAVSSTPILPSRESSQPLSLPATSCTTPTRPWYINKGGPRKALKNEAQTKLLKVLCGAEDMDVQALMKALEWKKTYARCLGSLYAFVKRECKDVLTYDEKGIVRIAEVHAMSGVHALLTDMSEYSEYGDAYDYTDAAYAASADDDRMPPSLEEPDVTTDESPAEGGATPTPTPEASVDPEVNDIAQSLMNMVW
eukprot:TRINITY_DN1529_c0_g5_i1.p1 TRINITY_DN1529_c0_g5~~TRINITY_DN1529_c0_g5_i1.p1  ORF type:complete len:323 (+),score=124.98 TRINITY_DN1529_c0_g5_i1:69-971(+)